MTSIDILKAKELCTKYISKNLSMGDKAESEIHCNCTDEEIAKSFIEDVEAVKDLLPKAESEES